MRFAVFACRAALLKDWGGADGYEHGFGALRYCDASIGEGKSAKFGREEAYSSAQSILTSPYKKGRIGCPLATDPALLSKQDNRYLPEPTSAGNKPARALSCSAVVRFPEGCDAFWPFTATPSYLRASMILSSAAFIEIPPFSIDGRRAPFHRNRSPKKRIQDTVISSLMQPYLDTFLTTH